MFKNAVAGRPARRGIVVALALIGATGLAIPVSAHGHSEFNHEGNILISDQFNNRVIEVDRDHDVIWQFGVGPNDVTANSVIGVNDAQRVGDLTLIAGTGAPAGSEPLCPTGCADNRVMLVNQAGHIVWQYGTFGVTGAADNQLNTPVQSTWLPNRHVLITDQGNARVIEVSQDHKVVWQYGTGTNGSGPGQLNNPNSAELLDNGHILIADENNNRVIEVNRKGEIKWQYPATPDPSLLSGAAFASRLSNGRTLITDSNNNRVIEVDHGGKVVWSFVTSTRSGSNPNPLPTRAVRLENGHTLISDQFNHQVIEVDHGGSIVFTQGAVINVAGDGFNQLNAPYDAKVVGDYTGLTPPFDEDDSD